MGHSQDRSVQSECQGQSEQANLIEVEPEPIFARNERMRGRVNAAGGSGDPNRGNWCTPKWVADMIGPFDLDPCSNPRSHVRAVMRLALEYGHDGLREPAQWGSSRRVFINPPYEGGSVTKWIAAYKHTRFCFLLRFDPSTRWFAELYDACELVAIPRGRRINFEPPPGVKASSQTFPHALFYRRYADATPAVLQSCITWRPHDIHR